MAGNVLVKWDRERNLKFTFNALVEFEKAYGASLTVLDITSAGFFALQCLAWAGLRHESPKLSLQETGEFLQAGFDNGTVTMESLGADFGAALKASGLFKEVDKIEKNA